MKFKEGDELTWELFLGACKEVDDKCVKYNEVDTLMSLSFSTIEDVEKHFRNIGGITIDEFMTKIRTDYGI